MRLLILFLLAASITGCKDSSKIPDDFDYGKVENGIYSNKFFNLEMPIPDKWDVQNKEEVNKVMERGARAIEQNNETLAKQIKASAVTSAQLLMMFKYNPDSLALPVNLNFNPSVMIMAENLAALSQIKTGEAYLAQARQLLERSGMGYDIEPGYTSKKIGNKEFAVLKASKTTNGVTVTQLYCATITHRFALDIVISYSGADQEDELMDILHTIKVK